MEVYFYFMDILKNEKHRSILKYIIAISLLIPVLIVAYEIIILGKDTVVLLVDFPSFSSVLALLYYGALFVIGIGWGLIEIKQILKLRNEKVKNELKYLKAQVSPHFFFNMLNNLYGLIEKDAPKAKTIVLELSEMMRYSIYKGENEYVTLKEEINFVQNFINLHKMRYYKDVKVDFIIDVDDENMKLMPLLFINLVENAFKHGVENLRDKAYVYIKLKTKENNVYFEVENNFDVEVNETEGGMGLQNLIRRLDLVYPNKYSLEKMVVNDVFNIRLTLYNL